MVHLHIFRRENRAGTERISYYYYIIIILGSLFEICFILIHFSSPKQLVAFPSFLIKVRQILKECTIRVKIIMHTQIYIKFNQIKYIILYFSEII